MQNRQWQPKFKVLTIGLGVILSLVLMVLAGGSLWLSSEEGQRMIRDQVNGAIPGTLSWEDLNLSLYAGRIELMKPRLQGPSGKEIISLDRIFINLSWTALFRKQIAAEAVILETPRVDLASDPNGDLNIVTAFVTPDDSDASPETDDGDFPFAIVIDNLALTDGFFQYELESLSEPGQRIAIHDIGFSLTKGDFKKQSATFSLRTGKGEMNMAGIQTALEAFRFDGELHRGDLKDAVIALDSALANLNAAGNVGTIFSAPLFDLDLRLKGSLSQLQRTLDIPTELTGPVALHLMMRGIIDNPEATLTLNYAGGAIAGNQVDQLTLACRLNEKQLAVTQLDFSTPLGQVAATGEIDLRKAFEGGFAADTRDLEAIAYKVNLTQTGTRLEQLAGPDARITGTVSSTLAVDGMGISPETLTAKAQAALSARDVAMEALLSPFDLNLKVQADFENQHVVIRQLDLGSGETHVEARGSYDLSSNAVGAVLALTASDLSKIMVAPVAETLTGKARLDVVVRGSVTHPEVDARLSGDNLSVAGIPLGTLRVGAALDTTGQVTLSELELQNNDSLLQAEGTIQVLDNGLSPTFPADLAVRFQHINAADFLDAELLSGLADGVLTVTGPLLSPSATLTLQGRSLAVENQNMGDLDARLRLHQGLLLMDEVHLKNGASDLTLSGTARILHAETGSPVENPSFDLTLGGAGLFMEDFIEGMQGKLALTAHLQGDATHPKGTLSLEGQNMDLGIQKIHTLSMASSIDKDRVTMDSLKVALAPGEEIVAEGWLSLTDQAYALKVTSKGVSLEHIDPVGEKNAAQGKVALTVTGEGRLDAPRLTGEVAITQLRLNNEPFDDSTLSLGLQDDIVSLKGDLVANLEGWFNLETQAFFAKATLDRTPLEPFFKMVHRSDLTGSITGHMEAEGNAASPENVRAVAEISQLSVSHGDIELVSAGVAKASVDKGTLLVPTFRLSLLKQGHLHITGEGTQSGPMDFKADGALPLEVIHLFADDLTGITGDVTLAAQLKGPPAHPDFQTDITLNDIGLTVPVLEQKLHSINGRIQVTPEALTIETITGNLDKGRLDLTGRVALKNFLPVSVNARLKAQALPILLPDTLEALINGELTFAGTPEQSLIAGEIIILEGQYYKDVKLGLLEGIGKRQREAAPTTQSGTTPLMKNTNLNISIRHRSPFIVDNNMALMALKPTFKISGPLSNPLLNGRAEVESGLVSYLGKEFTIKKGVVDFLNPYKIEATIDVDSEITIRKWLINLKVSGVSENLKFEMTSTPNETDADIISLLIFNKTRAEMIKGEGGSSTSTKQVFADLVANTLEGSLKDATGLDTIEMKYTERTDQADADDVNITVGKELSKRITLKYGVGTKNGETVQSAITEYKFYENVLMNAFRDSDGDFGGELMFRLETR